jgi:hypothetical protein
MKFNQWNFVLILLLSILLTAAAGVYFSQEQAGRIIGENASPPQQKLAAIQHTQDIEVYPERQEYETILLENITAPLHGSDPATLAMNVMDDQLLASGRREVEVIYPQPNQALVKIQQYLSDDAELPMIEYRVEMNTLGRSLLVTSPPIWQIVWAGSQIQSSAGSSRAQN